MKRTLSTLGLMTVAFGVSAQSDLGQGYVQLVQSMLNTRMMNHVLQNSVRAARGQRTASDAAETHFRNEAHVDLRWLKITDHGFVPA